MRKAPGPKIEGFRFLQIVTNTNGHPRAVYHVAVQHFVSHFFIRLIALGVHEDP